ncbi:hypothetical protein RRG08_004614 [Elysia crispata]|uniref:Uncharacterized protein n=1 Tax=Elysia crispata TaxID=231223 RepID=A0AAE1A6Q2_9GAST|nr:hypothetical protein RRG08_004614 [Elysia crispata]
MATIDITAGSKHLENTALALRRHHLKPIATTTAPDQNTPHQRTDTSSGLATRLALSRCSVYRTLQTWPIFGKFSDTFLVRSGRTPTRRASSTLSMQCSIYSSHPQPPLPTTHLSLAGSNWTKHQS